MKTNRQDGDPRPARGATDRSTATGNAPPAPGQQPALRARIGRTHDGMFRAEYTSPPVADGRAAPTMPDSPVMLTESELRAWVEQMAHWSGFSHVAWEDGGATGDTQPLRF